jgi:hypothetical protein
VFDLLDGNGLVISEIWAVCNPMLVQSFSLTLEKFTTRFEKSPELFYSQNWMQAGESEEKKGLRTRVLQKLASRAKMFPWNTKDKV